MIAAIPKRERDERRTKLIADAVEVADDADGLIGYVLLGFYANGLTRRVVYRPTSQEHKIGSAMFDAWAKHTLDSHLHWLEARNAARSVMEN